MQEINIKGVNDSDLESVYANVMSALSDYKLDGGVSFQAKQTEEVNTKEVEYVSDFEDTSDEESIDTTDNKIANKITPFPIRDGFSATTKKNLVEFKPLQEGESDASFQIRNSEVLDNMARDYMNPETNPTYFSCEDAKRQPTPQETSAYTASDEDLERFSKIATEEQSSFLQNIIIKRKAQKKESFDKYSSEETVKRKEKKEYSKDVLTLGDKEFPINKVMFRPTWMEDLYQELVDSNDTSTNLDTLTKYVTNGILNEFGGSRIQSIYIISDSVIVNNTCYTPVLKLDYTKFPADVVYYLQNGLFAYFVDWSVIKAKAKGITSLGFDSMQYISLQVASTLGLGRRIVKADIFNAFHNLYDLTVGNETVTIDDLNNHSSKKSAQMTTKFATAQRSRQFTDSFGTRLFAGWKPNIISGTDYFQSFFTGSFKNYLENRGNKPMWLYAGGVLFRGVGAAGATVVNGAAHLVKGIFGVFKDAFTPISNEDAGIQ